MYEFIQALLDDLFDAGTRVDRRKAARIKIAVREALEASEKKASSDPIMEVCTVPEAAQRLNLSETTIRRMIYAKELSAFKSGGVWLIRLSKIEREAGELRL